MLGNVNPSGKLCVSYPKTEDKELYCYNNGEFQERIAYPFGSGLSYTSFEYSDIKVPSTAQTTDDLIEVSCKVKIQENVQVLKLCNFICLLLPRNFSNLYS